MAEWFSGRQPFNFEKKISLNVGCFSLVGFETVLITFFQNINTTYFNPILTSLSFKKKMPLPCYLLNVPTSKPIYMFVGIWRNFKNGFINYLSSLYGEEWMELVQTWSTPYNNFAGWLPELTNWKERKWHRTKGWKDLVEYMKTI